ncbi:hypothetical protein CNR22_02145 [Sphingobacteriaceae bacterium]|nr:hypothetical protein CNR22_02145 [Sphingobacteriaceae bacterium]
MKYLNILVFLLCYCAQAQDTLNYKQSAKKTVVNILYTTDDEVIYKKMKDKADRSFIVSKSQLKSIAFRDSTVQKFQDPDEGKNSLAVQTSIIDTAYQNRFMTLTPEQRKKLYEYGVLDAQDFYSIGSYVSGGPFITGSAPLPGGGVLISTAQDDALQYPNKVLFKYADYRKGYQDEAGKMRRKYHGQFALGAVAMLTIVLLVVTVGSQ